ncbi:hypothetical protein LIER_10726 [Lithospermum erythrorhizon]|uniref:Uncharacterized protein n=1 Tax=Lithospermum erythrorhizon TaxID=34254 RepID=A0AAV3PLN2_LITER
MNPNEDNDHPQGSDGINLNNPTDKQPEDAPPNAQGPIPTGVIGQLNEQFPHLMVETPAVSSFVQEDWEETYTHTHPVPNGIQFNLVPGANQKIAVIDFIEGLRMRRFKESLLKKRPSSLEEVNERAYKYIRTEEAEKTAERECGIASHGGNPPAEGPGHDPAGNVSMGIEDKRMLPRPPEQKTLMPRGI